MPRDSGGTFVLVSGNPVISGTIIASTWANNTMDDIAIAMTDSLSRSGNGGMTAPLKLPSGSVGNPSLTFNNDPLTGRYLAAAGDMRDTVSATDLVKYTPETVEVFGTKIDLDNSAAATLTRVLLRNSEGGLSLEADDGSAILQHTNASGTSNYVWIKCIKDLGVELYHDDVKKLETTTAGAKVTGSNIVIDNSGVDKTLLSVRNTEGGAYFAVDNGDGLFQQTNATGTVEANWIVGRKDAAVELYYDGAKSLETTANGANVLALQAQFNIVSSGVSAAECRIRNSEGGLIWYANDGGSILYQTLADGTIQKVWIRTRENLGVELYYNNSKKLETTAIGIDVFGTVNEISDIKLKENLEIIPNALDKVCAMNGYTFDMKGEDTPRRTGVVAQEVQAVLPEAVGETDDGTLTVAYGNLVGVLIESIKELKAEVELLKAN